MCPCIYDHSAQFACAKKRKGHGELKQDKGFLLTSFRLVFAVLVILILLLES